MDKPEQIAGEPAQDLFEFLDEFMKDPRIVPHLEVARQAARKDIAAILQQENTNAD